MECTNLSIYDPSGFTWICVLGGHDSMAVEDLADLSCRLRGNAEKLEVVGTLSIAELFDGDETAILARFDGVHSSSFHRTVTLHVVDRTLVEVEIN